LTPTLGRHRVERGEFAAPLGPAIDGRGGPIGFHGTAFPSSSQRQVGEGRWRVISGTRAYANLRGRGSFVVVADNVTGTVKGSLDGEVTHDEDD
jgi:hypothetical protein